MTIGATIKQLRQVQLADARGIILSQQAQPVQSSTAHLIEDMRQGGGTVLVDIQRLMTHFLPGEVPVDRLIEGRMNMNINKHRPILRSRPGPSWSARFRLPGERRTAAH